MNADMPRTVTAHGFDCEANAARSKQAEKQLRCVFRLNFFWCQMSMVAFRHFSFLRIEFDGWLKGLTFCDFASIFSARLRGLIQAKETELRLFSFIFILINFVQVEFGLAICTLTFVHDLLEDSEDILRCLKTQRAIRLSPKYVHARRWLIVRGKFNWMMFVDRNFLKENWWKLQ